MKFFLEMLQNKSGDLGLVPGLVQGLGEDF